MPEFYRGEVPVSFTEAVAKVKVSLNKRIFIRIAPHLGDLPPCGTGSARRSGIRIFYWSFYV
jgi:hypothetical protein